MYFPLTWKDLCLIALRPQRNQIKERFPGYDLPNNFKAVYQPDGGVLIPEKCITAFTDLAKEKGALIK